MAYFARSFRLSSLREIPLLDWRKTCRRVSASRAGSFSLQCFFQNRWHLWGNRKSKPLEVQAVADAIPELAKFSSPKGVSVEPRHEMPGASKAPHFVILFRIKSAGYDPGLSRLQVRKSTGTATTHAVYLVETLQCI